MKTLEELKDDKWGLVEYLIYNVRWGNKDDLTTKLNAIYEQAATSKKAYVFNLSVLFESIEYIESQTEEELVNIFTKADDKMRKALGEKEIENKIVNKVIEEVVVNVKWESKEELLESTPEYIAHKEFYNDLKYDVTYYDKAMLQVEESTEEELFEIYGKLTGKQKINER